MKNDAQLTTDEILRNALRSRAVAQMNRLGVENERMKEVQRNYNDLYSIMEDINAIMWESYMIKDRDFGRVQGSKIMSKLNEWADRH